MVMIIFGHLLHFTSAYFQHVYHFRFMIFREIRKLGSYVIVGLLLKKMTVKLSVYSSQPTPTISQSLISCSKMKLVKISLTAIFGSRL